MAANGLSAAMHFALENQSTHDLVQAFHSLVKMQKDNGNSISFILNHNLRVVIQDLKIA
jgi:hypothetical protein